MVRTMNIHAWQLIRDVGSGASFLIPAAAPRQSAELNELPLSDSMDETAEPVADHALTTAAAKLSQEGAPLIAR